MASLPVPALEGVPLRMIPWLPCSLRRSCRDEAAAAEARGRFDGGPAQVIARRRRRALDPENTLYLEFSTGRVVIELAPEYAPANVAAVRALARDGYFDASFVIRSQDNYVVQWARPETDERAKAMAKKTLRPEFTRPIDARLAFARLPYPDTYAPEVGFSGGFAVARDPKRRQTWMVHCYGSVGVGRDDAADSGNGSELYAVIGQSPRTLDRNITLIGRVVQGIELLSVMPRAGRIVLRNPRKASHRRPHRRRRAGRGARRPRALRAESAAFQALGREPIAARRGSEPVGLIDLQCRCPCGSRRRATATEIPSGTTGRPDRMRCLSIGIRSRRGSWSSGSPHPAPRRS